MSRFNIVHVINEQSLGAKAYQEVIETVRWGLEQLGHDTTVSVNICVRNATNIVFGGHISPALLVDNPDNIIYYNLEQIRGHADYIAHQPHDAIKFISSNVRIWDYSAANIDIWNGLNPKHTVKFLPICYAPVLNRIERAGVQDIDVLIYGTIGDRRLSVFSSLGRCVNLGLSTVFSSGLYGAARDALIARSKIVLNINHFDYAKIFEIVRVSYLLANAKAVVADFSPDTYIESDIIAGVLCVPVENIAETCLMLLNDPASRARLEQAGFECIARRDIRAYLSAALA